MKIFSREARFNEDQLDEWWADRGNRVLMVPAGLLIGLLITGDALLGLLLLGSMVGVSLFLVWLLYVAWKTNHEEYLIWIQDPRERNTYHAAKSQGKSTSSI